MVGDGDGRKADNPESHTAATAEGPSASPAPDLIATPESLAQYPSIGVVEIDQLLQCPNCRGPIHLPVTLPCGHSGCKTCLQTQHLKEGILFRPPSPGTCRCLECGQKHTRIEYEVDVTLNKVTIGLIAEIRAQHRKDNTSEPHKEQDVIMSERVVDEWRNSPDTVDTDQSYYYTPPSSQEDTRQSKEESNSIMDLEKLGLHNQSSQTGDLQEKCQEAIQKQVDCEICYGIMLEPVTTPCGHSFCRRCLVRVLDHAGSCPVCRRAVSFAASGIKYPPNARLQSILELLFPEKLDHRKEAVQSEEAGVSGGFDIPLFICMLSFPSMPTYLFIFEPRYRLMMRRVMAGNRLFGMVAYNNRIRSVQPGDTSNPAAQAASQAGFCEFGTVLYIDHIELMPDGTSVVQTRGVSRFRVRNFELLDGYLVSKVDPVEDCGLPEEHALETLDMLDAQRQFEMLTPTQQANIRQHGHAPDVAGFSSMRLLSNEELMHFGHNFIARMRARDGSNFMHLPRNIVEAFGPPPADAATFPYWFAAIVSQTIPDQERYRLLSQQTRRQRLLTISTWINNIDRHTATTGSSCSIF